MLSWLAEKRVQEAIDRGELDHYEGFGEPFPEEFFNDQPYIEEDMKQVFKVLKGASILPQEMLLKKELHVLRIRLKSKRLNPEERQKLIDEMSIKEIEFQARMEFFRS